MIQLVTFSDLTKKLIDNNDLYGAIAFKESKDWKEKEGGYSLAERTYIFSGTNKAFGNYWGCSCFASDIAKTDPCIRLEQYWDEWGKLACWVMEKKDIEAFEKTIKEWS